MAMLSSLLIADTVPERFPKGPIREELIGPTRAVSKYMFTRQRHGKTQDQLSVARKVGLCGGLYSTQWRGSGTDGREVGEAAGGEAQVRDERRRRVKRPTNQAEASRQKRRRVAADDDDAHDEGYIIVVPKHRQIAWPRT